MLSILESLLITVRSSNPKVKKAYLKSDEAGCYHNSQLIVAARDVGERVGVSLREYDFSEPQSGKDVCDTVLCPLKGAIRRYCNEGHDVSLLVICTRRSKKGKFKDAPQLYAA